MGNVLQFHPKHSGFQPVKSTYTVAEISRQFGLSKDLILRWTRESLILTASPPTDPEPRYGFQALTQFRHVRALLSQGISLQKIARELRGQLNLFPVQQRELISIPIRRSAFEQALFLHDTGDPRAAEFFRRAIEESDCVADAYCNLGILEFEGGSLPKAFDCFTHSLTDNPRHFESHYNLANLYFEMSDYRLAREHYELAGVIEPNFPNLYFNLGLVHAIQGDLKSAKDAFDKYQALVSEEEALTVTNLIAQLQRAIAEQPPASPMVSQSKP